ncbi:MAG: Ig-like domain-containing protein [Ruminococcus sp.]|nr:Ig-like domain-containing protein [Ruminococcus sp.]
MKTEKIIASVMAAALSITAILPLDLLEMNTNAFSVTGDSYPPVVHADENYTLGDVNGDSLIDASDASAVLAEYSLLSIGGDGTFKENQKISADIDKNELIDSSDAALILSYYSYTSTGGKLDMQAYLDSQTEPPPAVTTTATTDKPVSTTSKPATVNTTTIVNIKTTTTVNVKTTATETVKTTTAAPKPTTTTVSDKTTATTTKTTSITTVPTTSAVSATTTVTLNPDKVSDIRISQTKLSINVGQGALAANVTMLPSTAKNKDEIWTSSDENIAVVDNEGWVTGIGEGTCIITVISVDNPDIRAEITVNVTDISSVRDIRLSRTEMAVQVGHGELSAYVTMLPTTALNKAEKWSSSNEEIAIVDNEGWVIGKKAGSCAVTVQSIDNPAVFAIIVVTVYDDEPPVTTNTTTETNPITTTTTTTTTNVKVTEILLSKYEMNIPVGKEDISIVTMLPYEAITKDEIWISSDETIATVNKYGWVKGISVGECIVTVYSVSNPEIKAEITVKIIDENTDFPAPDVNFSYVIGDKSDNKNIAFCTPVPKNASGRFVIDYIITDSDGNVKTISTSTILAPEMNSVITMLTADTSEFTVEEYVTNLATNERAKIGKYKFCLSPRNAESVEENIYSAFCTVNGLSD